MSSTRSLLVGLIAFVCLAPASRLAHGRVLLGAAAPAAAEWTASAVSGDVMARPAAGGAAWRLLEQNERLRGPIELATGPDGQARIGNGEVAVLLGPGGRLDLPDPRPPGRRFRMVLHFGTSRYDAKFRSPARLEVETPSLIARCTGTSVTVGAGPAGASVHVTDGAAAILGPGGAPASVIGIGQTASVRSAPGQGDEPRRADHAAAALPADDAPLAGATARASEVRVIDDRAEPDAGALPAPYFIERLRTEGTLPSSGRIATPAGPGG